MGFRAPSDSLRRRAPAARRAARRRWLAVGGVGAALLLWLGGCRADDLLNPQVPDVGAEDPLPGGAERLEFMTQPADVTLGGALGPIQVVARDEDGRVATDYAGIISLDLDAERGEATLRGTTGRPAVAGIAVFSNLSLDAPGRFRLEASAHGLRRALSESFDVRAPPGRPVHVDRVSGHSQTDTINSTLGDLYVVRLLDDGNAPIPGVTVRWRVESGGGAVTPELQVTNDAGQASARHTLGRDIGEQRVDAIVQGDTELRVTFVATAVHGAPASLQFTQQPSDTEEDERIRPPVAVTAIDRLGNRTTRSSAEVSVSLLVFGGSRSARLRGGRERRLENGTAVFSDLRVDREGVFQLRAQLGGLSVESGLFRVFDD